MAYDERLANRLRKLLASQAGSSERKMFGGLAFLVDGHMCVGIVGEDLMVRVGPEQHAQALAAPHARPMDFTGRPSKGMVYVAPAGWTRDPALKKWVALAVAFVASLPAKAPQRSRNPKVSRVDLELRHGLCDSESHDTNSDWFTGSCRDPAASSNEV